MNEERIECVAHRAEGAFEKALGRLTGDTEARAEGAAEKVTGEAQDAMGSAEVTSRDVVWM